MDFEEKMVDNEQTEDLLSEEVVEESEDSEESLESLDEEAQTAEEQTEAPKGTKEPGYVQGRIDKAVQKALAEHTASIRESVKAELDAQYAPIRERLLEMDAKELVNQGEFKSLERAKEYLQLKQGITPPPPQPRNAQGQYAPKMDPGVSARIEMLAHQADTIKAKRGIDVMDEFDNNPEIKNAVLSGKMDFYEVAENMKPKRRPPAPSRAPKGANGVGPMSIDSMSDAQFAKLDKRLDEGKRFTIKR